MSTGGKPNFRYLVMSIEGWPGHMVAVVHDQSPDLFRRVATFGNKRRAEDYAEMENDFRPGGNGGAVEEGEAVLGGREGDDQPALAAPEPPSALKPGELVRRTPVLEVAQALVQPNPNIAPLCQPLQIEAPAREDGEANTRHEPLSGLDTTPPQAKRVAPSGAPLSRDALTDNQRRVLLAMQANAETLTTIAAGSKVPNGSITSVVLALEKKSLVVDKGIHRAPRWHLTDKGRALISGTAPPSPAPQTPDASALDLNEFSFRQRSVIAIVATKGGDIPDALLDVAGIKKSELPTILERLKDKGAVEFGADGKWRLTVAGLGLHAEMKAQTRKQLPGPEVKLSTPTMRPQTDPYAVQRAIDDHVQTKGVRKFEEEASAKPLKMAEYLEKKGHRVEVSGAKDQLWIIDGKVMAKDEVLVLVNNHRRQAELAPLTAAE
jgi:DNA-binding MarR family transcriptional regulator